MTTAPSTAAARREPELLGQTVVIIGGSAGIGLETARRARTEGAGVVLAARRPDRLQQAAAEVGASRTAAFDATDPAALERFFAGLPAPVDHVMVTGPGPYYAPLAELDRERTHRAFDDHQWLAVEVARLSAGRVRPGGTLLFMGGTGGRRLRRHPAVRVTARRRPGSAPGPAPRHAPDRPRGRPGRRSRPRRPPHDQHGHHRRHLRHRRRPAAHHRSMRQDRPAGLADAQAGTSAQARVFYGRVQALRARS